MKRLLFAFIIFLTSICGMAQTDMCLIAKRCMLNGIMPIEMDIKLIKNATVKHARQMQKDSILNAQVDAQKLAEAYMQAQFEQDFIAYVADCLDKNVPTEKYAEMNQKLETEIGKKYVAALKVVYGKDFYKVWDKKLTDIIIERDYYNTKPLFDKSDTRQTLFLNFYEASCLDRIANAFEKHASKALSDTQETRMYVDDIMSSLKNSIPYVTYMNCLIFRNVLTKEILEFAKDLDETTIYRSVTKKIHARMSNEAGLSKALAQGFQAWLVKINNSK